MMVVKTGRFGKFLACPGYPECKNTKPLVVETSATCPKCGGKVIQKRASAAMCSSAAKITRNATL